MKYISLPRFSSEWIAVVVIGIGIAAGPRQAVAQRALGVDVSSYQGGSVNWSSVHGAGVSFAWAKATEGTDVIDGDFVGNENNGKAAGVYMGAYDYEHSADNSPGSEASYFWSEAGGYIKADGLTLMPMLDFDLFSGVTGASSYSDWANQWCQDVVNDVAANAAFAKPAIYVSACHAGNFDSSVAQWYNFIADWSGDAQTGTPWSVCSGDDVWGSGVWNFWQYNDTASYPGFPGEQPDSDVFNGTVGTLAANYLVTSLNYAIYTWDPQGTSGGNPYTGSMTGTWENSSWSTSESGQASPVGWTEGKAACFGVRTGNGTPAFTVTMNNSHNVAGIFDGALAPNSCNVTITGGGTIDISGQQGFDIINNTDGSYGYVTIYNEIAGSGQMVNEGDGQLYLYGPNSYSGGTMLGYSSTLTFNGIINYNNNSSFGAGPIIMTAYASGCALVAQGGAAITLPNAVNAATETLNVVPGSGGTTFAGPWNLGSSTPTIGTGSTGGWVMNISGVINGSGGITKNNNGTLVLSGVNTYSGPTTISSGPLVIGDPGQLGSGSYGNTIADGGSFTYASSATQTLSGGISGGGPVIQNGPGTLTLSGGNSYTGGTSINGGILNVGSGGALSSSGTINFGGGTLQYSSANTTDYSSRFAAAQPWSIDVNGQGITLSTALSGAGSLTVSDSAGGGILNLPAANTYTGASTINSGTLQLAAANSVPSGSSVCINNGATFNMNGLSDSIATLSGVVGGTLPSGNVINNNGTLTINGTTVVDAGESGSGAYSGIISGSGNVVISGGGSTTFSGANAYGGSTTVSGGILVPSYNGTLPSGSALTINTPGVFDIVSVNETIPSLSGSGTVNLESGTLTVGSGSFSGVIQNAPATYNNGASASGLQGFYYPAVNFSGTPIIRVDSTVNFSDLTQSSQNPLYPQVTEFSIRWIGQLLTTSTGGSYTFTTTSDDGSRCWVNGQLVVDNWIYQGATARSGTITLNANTTYDIRVEYMQGGGGASCVLSWTPPGGTSAVIPAGNLFTYPGVGGLVKTGGGTLTLNGANTYAGTTTIGAGALALGSSGAINNSPTISIAAGATFDVSAIASYALSGSTTLNAGGTSSAATIKGGTTVSLGSQPIILAYDGSHPALTISQGTLSLNGNAFTVNGSTLAAGAYTIVHQASGSITSSGSYTVTGTAIPASGFTAAISVNGGNVILTINANIATTTTTLNALTPSSYGQSVTFTATVAPTPSGGTVQFYDNGVALGSPVAVSGGTASYPTSTLSLGSHPITASYSGTSGFTASSTTSASTQQVNQATLTITANAQSRNYGTFLPFGSGSTQFTSSGLASGDTVGSVTLGVSGNGGSVTAPVGTYNITPSQATGGTFNPANYSISYDTGTLTVTLPPNTTPVTIVSVALQDDGTVQMDFTGTPGYVYMIEAATSLTPPVTWTILSTNAADYGGTFSFTDLNAPGYGIRYYQTVAESQ